MSKAPERCRYCKGDNPDCGFCEMGRPLDTQEDWDRSWGGLFDTLSGRKCPLHGKPLGPSPATNCEECRAEIDRTLSQPEVPK